MGLLILRRWLRWRKWYPNCMGLSHAKKKQNHNLPIILEAAEITQCFTLHLVISVLVTKQLAINIELVSQKVYCHTIIAALCVVQTNCSHRQRASLVGRLEVWGLRDQPIHSAMNSLGGHQQRHSHRGSPSRPSIHKMTRQKPTW